MGLPAINSIIPNDRKLLFLLPHLMKRKQEIKLRFSPHCHSLVFEYSNTSISKRKFFSTKRLLDNLGDIDSIVIGGETTNFKVHQGGILALLELKKEAAALNLTDRENKFFFKGLDVPFYSWECVSLLTESRSYDFQIPDRHDFYILITAVRA